MPSAENSIVVKRGRPEVFAFVADHENDKVWRPGVLDIERASGEGRGAVYRQGIKGPLGRRIPADFEVTAYEKDSHVAFRALAAPFVRKAATGSRMPTEVPASRSHSMRACVDPRSSWRRWCGAR